MTRAKTPFSQNKKTQINPQTANHAPCSRSPVRRRAHQAASLNTPRTNLRLARGPRAPRASLRLSRRLRGFVTPTPIPPTGALNALTRRKCPGQLSRPRFLIAVINANDRISRVKPVKPRSTWVITLKTSPMNPNEPLDQVCTHPDQVCTHP
jgi:hypothetical protein